MKTGKECGGVLRGLAELPWVAAKVLEEYFSGEGRVPPRSVESKPQAGLPSI